MSPSGPGDDGREQQLNREKLQREAATGRRARSVLRGDLGPVLRRWVSGSVTPVSRRLERVLDWHLQGNHERVSLELSSPVFGLADSAASPELSAIARWALKDENLTDLTFAVLGTAISELAAAGDDVVPLTRILRDCGSAARETALGQFITQVQGSKAMLRVRKSGNAGWKQGRQMDAVAGLLSGQVRSGLMGNEDIPIGGKAVVKVLTQKGDTRQIELRIPEAGDWDLANIARSVKGERDTHADTWMSFAMVVLCAAQAEAGWFDLTRAKRTPNQRKKRRKAAHGLVLSEEAHKRIRGDLDKWLHMGFICEPMLVPPEGGDYLSVKHRAVAGGRGPMGNRTNAEGSAAWKIATEVMAGTAWSVAGGTLEACRPEGPLRELAERCEPDEVRLESILGGYARMAANDGFWLPIYMDFRGRVYTRPSLVTYQGGDLQKGLLCFPEMNSFSRLLPDADEEDAIVAHVTAHYGNGLDKASTDERMAWWLSEVVHTSKDFTEELTLEAEEPFQFYTSMDLWRTGQWDRIPCQIDGTCNGLQHLTALFGDEQAAPYVNLTASAPGSVPSDLYGTVAGRVLARLGEVRDPWARRLLASVTIDRKLTKKPVMVLPYGGTRGTIEEAVHEAILAQMPEARIWLQGACTDDPPEDEGVWADWMDGNYQAFSDRELAQHPLLRLDAQRLGGLTWDCITEVIPKAMAAMQTFRDIAKAVGDRTLEWCTPFEYDLAPALWVVQAKAASSASKLRFKGLALPSTVRGLKIYPGRDEIDAHAHVSGTVANFIHSLDAAHMARTMRYFQKAGGRSFGAIHDCYITRPSEMALLAKAAREAFRDQYQQDPLSFPVMMKATNGKEVEAFPSWYDLARQCGVSFPERGSYKVSEVIHSEWFFS